MAEDPKRLAVTMTAIKELFAKSGNLCAFPGCNHLMVTSDGNIIGQICHIEGAEPGGERFNASQSNEERRQVNNLIMLCYEHHVVTNNVKEFPVQRMQEMKAIHEAKFTDALQRIERAFVDEASNTSVKGGGSLRKLHEVQKWDLNDEQHGEMVEQFNVFAEKLRKVPRDTRELLLVLVERSSRPRWGEGGRGKLSVPHREIAAAVRRGDAEIREHVTILQRYGFAGGERSDENQVDYIYVWDLANDWRIWEELRDFSKKTGTPLYELIVDLNFRSLD